ncbi:E3 ubiquitin-protein ligase RNF14-like [Polymixia lowei]
MNEDLEAQEDELLALDSIFGSEVFVRLQEGTNAAGEIRVSVELPQDFSVSMRDGDVLRHYGISFLPPILLNFQLPEDYPSSSSPSFRLTCSWLTHTQLSAVCGHLDDLYQATRGNVVLFSWVQFLREEGHTFLNTHSLLELPSDENNTLNSVSSKDNQNDQNLAASEADQNTSDYSNANQTAQASDASKAEQILQISDFKTGHQNDLSSEAGKSEFPPLPQPNQIGQEDLLKCEDLSPSLSNPLPISLPSPLAPAQTLLSQLLIYNEAQKQKVFAATVFDCEVCLVAWPGSQCVELRECGHIYCQSCLAEFCKVQITEGNVRAVACPQPDCTATPTPAQVRKLVGEELFWRYDRLLLQSTLDCMPDVVYCPRRSCGCAVILEAGSKAALCSACRFAFCVSCRKSYHGADDCQAEGSKRRAEKQEAYLDLPQTEAGMRGLWDDYESGSADRRRLLDKRYGKHILRSTLEDCLSEGWMTGNKEPFSKAGTKAIGEA